jgi:hypothetical protein
MSSTQLESIYSSLTMAQTNPHNLTRQGWLRIDEFDINFQWGFLGKVKGYLLTLRK